MNRALLWTLAFLVIPLSAMAQSLDSASTAEPLRVMTYNIRFDNPADQGTRYSWSARRDRVASVIRFHQPAIVGIQEGLLHQVMDLEDRLDGYEWVGVGRKSGGDEYNAVFYRTRRVELLAHDTFWLSTTPNEPGSISWGAGLPRIATWVRVRDRVSGDTLLVMNTHFDHESREAQTKSARLLAEVVPQRAKGAPAVVMGDLNVEPDTPPIDALHGPEAPGTLRDAFDITETPHHGPVSTFNHFNPTVLPGRRLDYIFVSAGVRVLRHGHLGTRWNGAFPSDHLPVLVDLRLPK
jgi:endonuclease/exonuclease/phosphatase family metal-dependent hydrolase